MSRLRGTVSTWLSRRGVRRAVVAMALLVAPIVLANTAILGTFVVARLTSEAPTLSLEGINHLRPVDDRLWRGDAPDREGYVSLADHGVTTTIDLRAERDLVIPHGLLTELGIQRYHLPIRDGQTPSPELVEEFLRIVDAAEGRVFVHCGAGVGRTGAVVAGYLIDEKGMTVRQALRRNLEVGPPSLEQIYFVSDLADGVDNPPLAVSLFSRFVDGPRRIWTHLRFDSGIER